MQRRELFGSLISSFKNKDEKKESIIRPPYFNEKSLFEIDCKTCNSECQKSCEVNIIKILEDKTPTLDFSNSGCTYCDECAKACPTEVLKVEYKKPIDVKINIDMLKCLSWNNTMCFSCKDPCIDNAIEFIGMFRPQINNNCTSCGFCLSVCPSNAIILGE